MTSKSYSINLLKMSKPLECPVFEGNNPFTGKMIWDHRVNGGSEAIKEKLKTDYNWDGSSSVASIAANLSEDGLIKEWQLHIFGKSKGAKLDASTFFVEQDPGNYIRIQEMALHNLVFRGAWCQSGCPLTSTCGSIASPMSQTQRSTTE
jgi:hypothetical protein